MPSSTFVVELGLAAELIVAEAKRWSVADEVGLQVTPTGTIRVSARSVRAREFVERLATMQSTGGPGGATVLLAKTDPSEWDLIVRLARQLSGDVGSGHPVNGPLALKLARSILTLDKPHGSGEDEDG